MTTINTEWYRIFMVTAKAGNLTKAAQELFITQPSVSYTIKQLEEKLGVLLFQRMSKGVVLTAEGQSLLAYVEQSMALLEAGEKRIDLLKRLAGGELRIGASDSLIKHILLPSLEAYRSQYPEVHIRLTHGKTPDLIQRLKDGHTDCIVVPRSAKQDWMQIEPAGELADVFVVGEAYRVYAEQKLTAEELLKSLPLLMLSRGSSSERYAAEWFARQGLEMDAQIELGSVDLLVEFARKGFGAAFVARSFIEKELASGELLELRLESAIPARQLVLAYHGRFELPLAAVGFIAMKKNLFPAQEHASKASLSGEEAL